MKTRRQSLSPGFKKTQSQKICARILDLECYQSAKTIAIYHPIQGEVDLFELWQTAMRDGKLCCFPAIESNQSLLFLPASNTTTFVKNQFGIDEPQTPRHLAIKIEELDIIFMPLLAFDDYGTRVGMGAGYYDRTLDLHNRTLCVGVAYDFQRVARISPDPWDVPLSIIITEQDTYWSIK